MHGHQLAAGPPLLFHPLTGDAAQFLVGEDAVFQRLVVHLLGFGQLFAGLLAGAGGLLDGALEFLLPGGDVLQFLVVRGSGDLAAFV
ncbi:hypothetical protein D3C86_1865320 [compost metagenome]